MFAKVGNFVEHPKGKSQVGSVREPSAGERICTSEAGSDRMSLFTEPVDFHFLEYWVKPAI